jgi:pSer/pThr/pTyr-binding forkhead associated (FHA) protein
MAALIRILTGPEKDRVFPLAEAGTMRIGRARDANVVITDPTVSRAHCEIVAAGDQFTLADAGGRSGTFVNGGKISRMPLRHGDLVQIGETQFRFEVFGQVDDSTLMVDPARLPAAAGLPGGARPGAAAGTTPVRKVKPSPGPRPPQLRADRLQELTGHQLSHYTIGNVLAPGRTGLVFQAQDLKNNRPVALKILWPDFVAEPAGVKRLIRSMRTMLPLGHPHLVSVYSAGRSGPYCWIAMEYVQGESAAQVVERLAAGAAPDWPLALRVAIHISRALVFAHYHRILHRNITPANVLIAAPDQRGRLGDLMLAKALEGTAAEQLTAPGQLLGDVCYLPPERISDRAATADERSDLYSLGATFYALLTGQPPLQGANIMETLVKIWQEPPVPPLALQPGLPPELGEVALRLLAKNPAQRYQSAAALLGDLVRLARTLGVDA